MTGSNVNTGKQTGTKKATNTSWKETRKTRKDQAETGSVKDAIAQDVGTSKNGSYKVKSGDTFDDMAKALQDNDLYSGMTVSQIKDELKETNKIKDPNKIKAGQELKIRKSSDEPAKQTSANAPSLPTNPNLDTTYNQFDKGCNSYPSTELNPKSGLAGNPTKLNTDSGLGGNVTHASPESAWGGGNSASSQSDRVSQNVSNSWDTTQANSGSAWGAPATQANPNSAWGTPVTTEETKPKKPIIPQGKLIQT